MKKSKQAYYDKYFERNWNNIKNKWKGIKSFVSLKAVAPSVPTVLSLDNGDTTTSPYDIVKIFNNNLASIAETTKKRHKIFPQTNETSAILLQPTDKEEIANMSSLNSNKASGPSSIPYRILIVLKDEISKQLPNAFNLSLMTGVFPAVLKTAKVVSIFKKNSILDYEQLWPNLPVSKY